MMFSENSVGLLSRIVHGVYMNIYFMHRKCQSHWWKHFFKYPVAKQRNQCQTQSCSHAKPNHVLMPNPIMFSCRTLCTRQDKQNWKKSTTKKSFSYLGVMRVPYPSRVITLCTIFGRMPGFEPDLLRGCLPGSRTRADWKTSSHRIIELNLK